MAAQARLFYFDEADDRIDLESTEDLLGAYKSTVLSSKTHLKVVLLEGTEPLPSAPSGRGNPASQRHIYAQFMQKLSGGPFPPATPEQPIQGPPQSPPVPVQTRQEAPSNVQFPVDVIIDGFRYVFSCLYHNRVYYKCEHSRDLKCKGMLKYNLLESFVPRLYKDHTIPPEQHKYVQEAAVEQAAHPSANTPNLSSIPNPPHPAHITGPMTGFSQPPGGPPLGVP